jgi:alpha-glucosidase (family GH31 glycosyl hydrolase)
MKSNTFVFALVLFTQQFSIANIANAEPSVQKVQFKNQISILSFEVLSDGLLHFDYAAVASAPDLSHALPTTPLIEQKNFVGTEQFSSGATGFETKLAKVSVDPTTLCFTLFDKVQNTTLTRACPSFTSSGNALTLDAMQMKNVYGLGEQFQTPGVINGDWSGKIRKPGSPFGNAMVPFSGGNNGNAQFPILYALGPNSLNYALFLDTVYPLQWDFTASPWKINQTQIGTDLSFRGYFILGENLPALRSTYMDLVGHPLVPPKKAIGLWISEFGYRNWAEIQDKIKTLRAHHFPVDGFVLDLYWFGQYQQSSTTSAMGMLAWDTVNFPNPKSTIADFQNKDGIQLMTIEESYVSSGLANYTSMASRGFFANTDAKSNTPTIYDSWWGRGAGIDWSQPEAGQAWHNEHRKPELSDNGITFHWTDLGEPEEFDPNNFYKNPEGIGHTEADTHNLNNFLWDKSIIDGYESNHFILSRSGTSGIQKFGAAMWSGDIGPNMAALSGHLNAQMHMSLSGMDYFGSDVGGFMRAGAIGDPDQVYTRWFANSSLFDVPLRPHTDDGSKTHPTAPDRIGDLASNLANLRQRYELVPYYYSLSYRAYQFGEAVVPPLVYYYQSDANVRQIADEKMIGAVLLAAASANLSEDSRSVYLPAGDWIDYHTLSWYHSRGETIANFPVNTNGFVQLPLFAKAGAILPKATVDDQTMNVLGKRTDGSTITDLRVRVFASRDATQFHLIEDDGLTEAYRNGAFADTLISQVEAPHSEIVTIAATQGTYEGAPVSRINQVEMVLDHQTVNSVSLNTLPLTSYTDANEYAAAPSGWMVDVEGVVHAKSMSLNVNQEKIFHFLTAP